MDSLLSRQSNSDRLGFPRFEACGRSRLNPGTGNADSCTSVRPPQVCPGLGNYRLLTLSLGIGKSATDKASLWAILDRIFNVDRRRNLLVGESITKTLLRQLNFNCGE